MPNDLWSYRWILLRSFMALPLVGWCFISKRFSNRYKSKIDRFIEWDY